MFGSVCGGGAENAAGGGRPCAALGVAFVGEQQSC